VQQIDDSVELALGAGATPPKGGPLDWDSDFLRSWFLGERKTPEDKA
jgi:hypothetical protein